MFVYVFFFLFILPRYDCNVYNIGQPLKVILRNKFLTCDSRKPLLVSHFFNVGRMLFFVDLLKSKRLRNPTKLIKGTMCVTQQNSLSGSPGRRQPRTAMKKDEIVSKSMSLVSFFYLSRFRESRSSSGSTPSVRSSGCNTLRVPSLCNL